MKKCNKLFLKLLLAVFTLFSLFLGGGEVKASSIGQVLPNPGSGWRRYDCTATSCLSYDGPGWTYGGGSDYYSTYTSARLNFRFYGTKLRLNSFSYYNHTQNGVINIDGQEYHFAQRNDVDGIHHAVDFEIENLNKGVHSVSVGSTSGLVLSIRSIDIDSSGKILGRNDSVISLEQKSIQVESRKSFKLKAKLFGYNPSDIEWKSSDESVAKVSSDGMVYGIGKGNAVITAKIKGTSYVDTCIVKVIPTVLKFKCDYENVKLGDTVEVNYLFDCIDDMKFTSGSIQYDKDKLELESIEASDGIYFVKNRKKEGSIELSTALKNKMGNLKQGQVLAKIKFKALSKGDTSLKVITGAVSNKSFVSRLADWQLGTQSIRIF